VCIPDSSKAPPFLVHPSRPRHAAAVTCLPLRPLAISCLGHPTSPRGAAAAIPVGPRRRSP
jgi:hypothetical protein